ncbi:MAG: hypothetical protein ABWZ40_07050 [Caulobacterales bacterium]
MSVKEELWTGDRGLPTASQFGRFTDADELLHPKASIPGDSLTETWAYMWYVPEENISAMVHLWVHPNLNVVTAGIGVWRGHKSSMISAELMDVPTFCSAKDLGDGSDMTFQSGLRVQILEPFKKMRITYDDPARKNSVDLEVTDFSPPAMRGSENHFDQATWNKGRMTLRGRSYEVNSIGMRDRSWGQLRTEAQVSGPPFTWLTGSFEKSRISWNLAAFDDPTRNPDWKGLFDIDPAHTIHDGWIWRDNEMLRFSNAWKTTRRDPANMRPLEHDVHFTDSKGRDYHFTGKVNASVPWSSWCNMQAYICSTEWRWNGEIGWGDTQDCQWSDYQHALRQDQDYAPSR